MEVRNLRVGVQTFSKQPSCCRSKICDDVCPQTCGEYSGPVCADMRHQEGPAMGVGHAALALGAARATPRLNVGWLVWAAFLADFLLGVFAWMGLESAHGQENFATNHYLTF